LGPQAWPSDDNEEEEAVLTGDFGPQLDQLTKLLERGLFENDRLIIWRAGRICATKRGLVADEMEYDEVAILLGIQLPERPIAVPPQQLPPQLFTADRIDGLDIERLLLLHLPLLHPDPEL